MEATIKNGKLIVTIDLEAPRLSSTGKTLVVASSGGGKVTTATVDGKPITVNLTGWIKP